MVNRKIVVNTNDPKNDRAILTCKSRVLSPFKLEPRMLKFQRIKRSSEKATSEITIKRGDGDPIKPTVEGGLRAGLQAEIEEIAAGEEYKLKVTLTKPWPARELRTSLRLGTGITRVPHQNVTVYAQVEPIVSTSPGVISIPPKLTRDFTRDIKLYWATKERPNIQSARCTSEEIKVEIKEDESGEQFISLFVPADTTFKKTYASIIIRTDYAEFPAVTVPVRVQSSLRFPKRGNNLKRSRSITSPKATPVKTRKPAKTPEDPQKKSTPASPNKQAQPPVKGTPLTLLDEAPGNDPEPMVHLASFNVRSQSPQPTRPAPGPGKDKEKCGAADDETPATPRPAEPGTVPVFACQAPAFTAKPVWLGQPAYFSWKVSNPGTADLHLRLKGG